MNKNLIKVQLECDKNFIKQYIEKNHYSHKIPQAIKFRFGFYYEDILKGVSIFSIPANMYTITSIFNNETQHIGLELSRVFTENDTPKNFESYCLSKCFEYLKHNTNYDIVVSYADPNYNHAGYLYQALNGYYLGQTSSEIRYVLNGQLITRRGLGRSKNDSEQNHVKRIIDLGAEKIKMQGKYKYVFFICNKKRKKELLNKMKVELFPYPKLNS